MQAKTERFEMRLDQMTLEEVDAWRARQADVPSRAEAVRRLIEDGLTPVPARRELELSAGERLAVVMLCELHKHLKVESDINADGVAAAIYSDNIWALRWNCSYVIQHENYRDPEHVTEMINILDMWRFLQNGHAALSKAEKERVGRAYGDPLRFPGFDGNDDVDSKYASAADFLVRRLERFPQTFKDRVPNSHTKMLDRYRRMLKVFEPIRPKLVGRNLSVEEIIGIMGGAAQHAAPD